MTQLRKWNSQELADRYRREYDIDIRHFLAEDEVALERDDQSGVMMFRGGVPGDGPFYEKLHSSSYYRAEKWEFGEAIRCLSDLSKEARILEVGCGSGAFLDLCREKGFERAEGIELNERAVQQCRDKGHNVSDRLIEQLEDHENTFECLCAFQVLEHVPDPIAFLQAAARVVKPGGILILSTPNADSFLQRYEWCLLDLPPHHMSRWDEESYRKTAELLDLSIESITREPLAKYHYSFYANSLVEHLPRKSLRRKVMKRIARTGFAVYPWKQRIPGHSIMTVMRKPTAESNRHPDRRVEHGIRFASQRQCRIRLNAESGSMQNQAQCRIRRCAESGAVQNQTLCRTRRKTSRYAKPASSAARNTRVMPMM